MRVTCALVLGIALALPAQELRLDRSGAFFTTEPEGPAEPLVVTRAGTITTDIFARYAGDRQNPRMLENLAFALALTRECEAQGLARSAPVLARAMAARQFVGDAAPDARTRARLATEALRDLRTNALVGDARARDEAALRDLFEHRYGQGGVRVRVRHVLSTDARSAPQSAAERAQDLHRRLEAGEDFAALLPLSHDRETRRRLRDPRLRPEAGVLRNYNYHRYGDAFAEAVRDLDVGAFSAPVRSSVGVHLIQLLDRTVTRLDDVAPQLRQQLAAGDARSSEILRLREQLLTKYGYEAPAVAAASRRRQEPEQGPPPPTEWPHYRGNPHLHGRSAGRIGSSPELAWTFETKGEILSSPVIRAGVVYVGSTDNSVYAIDLETGEQRWSFATQDMVEAPPLVLDDTVYVGSSDYLFYALDAKSGALRWKHETQDRILGSANWWRGRDGRARVLVGSYDANVYCFDAERGDLLWTYTTDDFVNGSPAVLGGEAVFGGCDAALHLVDLETGERRVKVELGEGCQVAGSVALADGKAYFGHYGNEFLCVDLETGAIGWRYAGRRQGFVSSPALGDEHVVFGGRDRFLHCAARADGKPLWTFRTRRKVDASPVVCGDKVVFGSGDGRLYLLRLADGEQLWSYDVGRPVYSSPAVVDGMIVVGASDQRVYAFRAPADQERR